MAAGAAEIVAAAVDLAEAEIAADRMDKPRQRALSKVRNPQQPAPTDNKPQPDKGRADADKVDAGPEAVRTARAIAAEIAAPRPELQQQPMQPQMMPAMTEMSLSRASSETAAAA